MSYSSKSQQRWAHSPAGLKALGKDKVKEYDETTKKQGGFKNLKERILKKKK